MTTLESLKVVDAQFHEVGADIVRIHKCDRAKLGRWQVARLIYKRKSKRVIILGHEKRGEIWMDIDLRDHWDLKSGQEVRFTIKKVRFLGQVLMLAHATNPTTRVPMQIALLLGSISLLLGLVSCYPVLLEWGSFLAVRAQPYFQGIKDWIASL